jgi:3-methylcrotonyl-CoA carboxylase alpha subunit
MGAAAVAAAKASGYLGAGTVEFICRGDDFYFMEMNTRLQVEHPVTEMITGQDLVEWQFRVAAGEALPRGQDDLAIRGHAIEARIYAEDPANEFLPSTGRLALLRLPSEGPHVRVDTGVREGDEVTVHYDPMIAKVTVWGRNRKAAVKRLRAALGGIRILGPANNVAFLAEIAGHPVFGAGAVDTGFIARHLAELLPEAAPASEEALALASLAEVLQRRDHTEAGARRSPDPHSPWHRTGGWRLNAETGVPLTFRDGTREIDVVAHTRPGVFTLDLPGGRVEARGEFGPDGLLSADLDGRRVTGTIVPYEGGIAVLLPDGIHRLELVDPLLGAAEAEQAGPGRLTAPMPGKVIQVHVVPGQIVERGAPLMVLEAMKMEHGISAPADGKIAQVHYAAGDLVEEGAELIAFETETEV